MRATLVSVAILAVGAISIGGARQPAAPAVSGELRQWHKVTLTFNGPQANETDTSPNPFTDYRMTVVFTHESGAPRYEVPGYFAADGDAANTSATAGNKWRAHVSPDKAGRWNWRASLVAGPNVALLPTAAGQATAPVDGATGSFEVAATEQDGARLPRARPAAVRRQALPAVRRVRRVFPEGRRRCAGNAARLRGFRRHQDAQDGAAHLRPTRPGLEDRRSRLEGRQGQGPDRRRELSVVERHERDVVPHLQRGRRRRQRLAVRRSRRQVPLRRLEARSVADRLRSRAGARVCTCTSSSRKQENDDGTAGGGGGRGGRWLRCGTRLVGQPLAAAGRWRPCPCAVVAALDCGDTGRERRLYLRELIARFGYELALNWNLGEENTQTTVQQRAMIQYIHDVDPYRSPRRAAHVPESAGRDLPAAARPDLSHRLVAAERLERHAPADGAVGTRFGGRRRALGGGQRRTGLREHRRAAGSRATRGSTARTTRAIPCSRSTTSAS